MKESLLYFDDGGTAGVDTAVCMPASSFLGVRLVDADSCKIKFRSAGHTAAKVTDIAIDFTGDFKEATRAIAGALNSNTMTVVGDARNGVFLNYPGGSFKGTVSVDEAS